MKRYFLHLILLAAAACDPAATTMPTSNERGPIGKAEQMGSCEDACGGMSAAGCWCDDACVDFGDCCSDKADVCDGPGCASGFMLVDTSTNCLADAACYEVDGEGWCTGDCPPAHELDLDAPGGASCVESANGGCQDGFEPVATESDCLQDAACYEIPGAGWCTGECPSGTELQLVEFTGHLCVPTEAAECVGGFEEVPTSSDCLQDIACYELPSGAWCTGLCPEGTELDLSGDPVCV